jgi:hypothetical protein
MATLTREEYLKEFKRKAEQIISSKENAVSFYQKIGVLTPTGKISINYRHTPNQGNPKPARKS